MKGERMRSPKEIIQMIDGILKEKRELREEEAREILGEYWINPGESMIQAAAAIIEGRYSLAAQHIGKALIAEIAMGKGIPSPHSPDSLEPFVVFIGRYLNGGSVSAAEIFSKVPFWKDPPSPKESILVALGTIMNILIMKEELKDEK